MASAGHCGDNTVAKRGRKAHRAGPNEARSARRLPGARTRYGRLAERRPRPAALAILRDPELPLRWNHLCQFPSHVSVHGLSFGENTTDDVFSFRPSVIHDLNFTDTVALLLACPPYLFACVAALILAWSSGRYHERTWHITVGFAVAIAGFVAAAATTNTAGRYVACFVFPAGAFAVNSVITGWIATTLSQSREKKAVRDPTA